MHQPVDRGVPVEGITAPGLRKIAVFAEALHSTAQLLPGGLHARSASENPSNTLRWIGERALEPGLEGFVSKGFGCLLGGDFKQGVNPCLDRSFVQKVAAEGVYRADASELQVLERALQPVALLGCRARSSLFDLAPQAKLHLTGSFLSEGDGHNPVERAAAGADQPDDPVDECAGLAGPRRRLNKKARAELGHDPAACYVVGQIGHGSPRIAKSGSRRAWALRAVRRSSCGPQTIR